MMISILATMVSIFFSCSPREKVTIPPRMDLRPYGTVGIIDFSSGVNTEVQQYATQKYIQALQSAQPGVRVLELGAYERVLKKVKSERLDPEAVRAIGSAYHVDILLSGELTVSEPKANIRLSSTWESMQASADIDASLLTKLWETDSGATLWTRSSRRIENVAGLKADTGGNITFGATDPENAYQKVVPILVNDNTRDFRSSYEYRKVK
jgi:hypothetical protein